jgi:hypothetical protein
MRRGKGEKGETNEDSSEDDRNAFEEPAPSKSFDQS